MSKYIECKKILDFCNAVINRQGNEEEMNVVVESFKAFAEYVKALPPADVQPVRWIPWDSGSFPDDSGTYIVTAYDGAKERVTFAKFQKRLNRWELTGARAYWKVLAWMPLPPSYKGEDE